jgi:hypothetical protein
MMIGVLGSLAEYERELVKERTALKRETSRANGTKFGRPRKVDDYEHIATAKRMRADGHTGKDIAKYLGVSRATLYRHFTRGGAAWRGGRLSWSGCRAANPPSVFGDDFAPLTIIWLAGSSDANGIKMRLRVLRTKGPAAVGRLCTCSQ